MTWSRALSSGASSFWCRLVLLEVSRRKGLVVEAQPSRLWLFTLPRRKGPASTPAALVRVLLLRSRGLGARAQGLGLGVSDAMRRGLSTRARRGSRPVLRSKTGPTFVADPRRPGTPYTPRAPRTSGTRTTGRTAASATHPVRLLRARQIPQTSMLSSGVPYPLAVDPLGVRGSYVASRRPCLREQASGKGGEGKESFRDERPQWGARRPYPRGS